MVLQHFKTTCIFYIPTNLHNFPRLIVTFHNSQKSFKHSLQFEMPFCRRPQPSTIFKLFQNLNNLQSILHKFSQFSTCLTSFLPHTTSNPFPTSFNTTSLCRQPLISLYNQHASSSYARNRLFNRTACIFSATFYNLFRLSDCSLWPNTQLNSVHVSLVMWASVSQMTIRFCCTEGRLTTFTWSLLWVPARQGNKCQHHERTRKH